MTDEALKLAQAELEAAKAKVAALERSDEYELIGSSLDDDLAAFGWHFEGRKVHGGRMFWHASCRDTSRLRPGRSTVLKATSPAQLLRRVESASGPTETRRPTVAIHRGAICAGPAGDARDPKHED